MPVTKDALCWLKRVSWLNSDLSLQLRQEIHAPPVSPPGQALNCYGGKYYSTTDMSSTSYLLSNYTVNRERFAGLNFHDFWEYRKSFPMNF